MGSLEINAESIEELLKFYSANKFCSNDPRTCRLDLQEKCLQLFERDYKCQIFENKNGNLCLHYPNNMILVCSKQNTDKMYSNQDLRDLRELIKDAKFARFRERFAFPVIFLENKTVVRSGTLSSSAVFDERGKKDWILKKDMKDDVIGRIPDSGGSVVVHEESALAEILEEKPCCLRRRNKTRHVDVELLKRFNVHYICDLMVERKKNSQGRIISSSEKVDKRERYKDFDIMVTPYPGCEWFRDIPKIFSENVVADWTLKFMNGWFHLSDDLKSLTNEIDWTRYKDWDLVTLNENYIILIIKLLVQREGNLLLHCISGWHRTPMFISLIRLSLWADGVVHQTLHVHEILFLTLAYDWFLFGHNFKDALTKGESMLNYSFKFIEKMHPSQFSYFGSNANEDQRGVRKEKLKQVAEAYHVASNNVFGG